MNSSISDCDSDEDVNQSIDLISNGFNRQLDLQLLPNSDPEVRVEEDVHDEHDDHNDDDDDDFTFMLIGHDDDASNFDDKVFEDGEIRPVFPLFDRKLLLDGEYEIEEIHRLLDLPLVDKIFIESPRGFPSEHKQNDDDDATAGPYCAWSKATATATAAAELSKKSNSTGFSKLWRLKEKVNRSNSDGRDAFVFLKSSDKSVPVTSTASSSKAAEVDRTFVRVNVAGGKARVVNKGTKVKKPTVSAHEAYLRSRGHTEEERRRSYLPYRPELMGFFTNVHGGMSKNVHPY